MEARLCGELAIVYICLSAFFLLNSAVCGEFFLAREVFLFFHISLKLIAPLGFTDTKSKLSGKNGIGFHCHLCCGFWVFLFSLASILWLAGRSAGYSRIALVAFSLHFCCRKLEVSVLTVMKLIKHKQYSDTGQCIWRKGKCNFPRFGWSKAKSYFINFKQINIYNLLLVPSV